MPRNLLRNMWTTQPLNYNNEVFKNVHIHYSFTIWITCVLNAHMWSRKMFALLGPDCSVIQTWCSVQLQELQIHIENNTLWSGANCIVQFLFEVVLVGHLYNWLNLQTWVFYLLYVTILNFWDSGDFKYIQGGPK